MGPARLAVIAGPTAVGKTPVALALARELRAEIICADSRTLYRGMDVGTAKPTAQERRLVPHHLLDIASPDEIVTLAEYQGLATAAIDAIRSRGRLPLLVGGTGLYIKAIVDGYQVPPAPPDWALRSVLEAEERALGPGMLHRRLSEVDPAAAKRIHPRNLRRVIRALEVQAKTGVPISALQRSSREGLPDSAVRPAADADDVVMIALTVDRAELYARIHRRIEQHLAEGLIAEVRRLLDAGYATTLPALQAVGYKEIIPYLQGRLSLAECRALLQRNTRRYAKRQLTWLRRDARYRWLDVGDDPPAAVAARVRALLPQRQEPSDVPGGASDPAC